MSKSIFRIALLGLLAPVAPALAADVVVNGVLLEDSTHQALERSYGVPIRPGRYWYDQVSGVWGREGGPAEGQIHPGLRLGGPLKRPTPAAPARAAKTTAAASSIAATNAPASA